MFDVGFDFKNLLSPDFLADMAAIGQIFAIAAVVYAVLRLGVAKLIAAVAVRTRTDWDEIFVRRGTFKRLAELAPGIVVHALAGVFFPEDSQVWTTLRTGANLWIMFFGLLSFYAMLDSLSDIYNSLPVSRQLPTRSFTQVVKLVAFLAFAVVAVATLLGQSPAILLSGLGAMTAVLMLVFKDAILGFVAGIQLSANRMLAVGDWLEMPKYSADGDVIDITLTTVKVCNWDKTITTIPTYALISDSFKNWRGMQDAGGRRICRNLNIDVTSIRFLDETDICRLRRAQLLCKYIDDKLVAIAEDNRAKGVDPSSPINGRRLTNVGTFRAYLLEYIKNHPGIHKGMLSMVRQLQPTEHGLPIQIYTFTADTAWAVHEGVQADIFDHILAVVGEFDLRVHQIPSGADVRSLADSERLPHRNA